MPSSWCVVQNVIFSATLYINTSIDSRALAVQCSAVTAKMFGIDPGCYAEAIQRVLALEKLDKRWFKRLSWSMTCAQT